MVVFGVENGIVFISALTSEQTFISVNLNRLGFSACEGADLIFQLTSYSSRENPVINEEHTRDLKESIMLPKVNLQPRNNLGSKRKCLTSKMRMLGHAYKWTMHTNVTADSCVTQKSATMDSRAKKTSGSI